jgi:hypothetical protein
MTAPILQTLKTETHVFTIRQYDAGVGVDYQPLNPKTGEPWQRDRRVTIGATIEPKGYEGRPILYGNIALARLAMNAQVQRLAKSRG